MDDRRFDAFARALAQRPTRRGLVKGLAAAIAGWRAAGQGGAKAARVHCHHNGDCPHGASCQGGRCACDAQTSLCGSFLDGYSCENLAKNNGNCGECGHRCQPCVGRGTGAPSVCVNGACAPDPRLPPGFAFCRDICVDTTTDPRNCGGCDQACRHDEACIASQCQACPKGLVSCRGFAGCHDLTTDPKHCGGCAQPCPKGAICSNGQCACPTGQIVCGTDPGACTDTNTDPQNCGGCTDGFFDHRCSADKGEICRGGQCACADPSKTLCHDVLGRFADQCADLKTDAQHCGTCGHKCPLCDNGGSVFAQDYCSGGACGTFVGVAAGAQPAICGDQCVDTNNDPANCGSCGHVCPEGVVCRKGFCGCPDGQHLCGIACCADSQICCKHECCRAGVTACAPNGACACAPDCTGKECGPDGCGGSCGTCVSGTCQNGTCSSGGTCGTCSHWDDCPEGGTCSSCVNTGSGQCETVVCGGKTCPKPTAANHRAVCCHGTCDLACFATTLFTGQGTFCCEGYNSFGSGHCNAPVQCKGSSGACDGSCPP